jgi:hypothetical protein
MKRFLSAVTFLAIVHLLVLLMFTGWLWQSGRLSVDRIHRIREMLAMTEEEEDALAAERAAEVERAQAGAELEARRLNPPLPSGQQVQFTSMLTQQTEQSLRRLRDETEQLRQQQELRARQLDQREEELQQRQRTWEEGIAAEAERQADEQFQKTVKQYESAPAKVAKGWIMELVGQGEEAQVVAYLDAMNARAASRILREFKTEEEAKIATGLLEQLRTFGTAPPPSPVETP